MNHSTAIPLKLVFRQAELIKCAKEYGTMYLLPPGPKAPLPTVLGRQEAAAEARGRFDGMPKSKVLEEVWMNPG